MQYPHTCLFVISIWLTLSSNSSYAAEAPKKQEPELIPAPKQFVPPPPSVLPQPFVPQPLMPPTIILPPMPRHGTMEVWQSYGVDSTGRFRPRVILSPSGSYYQYNNEPYPWITNRTRQFMPYALD
jgi:hypothetical protein